MSEEFQMGVSTKGLISLLQGTLTDRYKDYFCIIQELLQNADDAEASTIVYGVRREGLNVPHVLAQLPGLFVINDGPVTRDNMAAIFSVAAGDKGNEKNKIGKFGLGMKSVFHACEGFFMFGKGHADGIFPQFCTPWLGPYHKDWREDWTCNREEMARQVEKIVDAILPNSKRWFCVWLPLRSTRVNDGIYPIIGEYPGDENLDDLVGIDYFARAARFLPMLKHVVELRFVNADGDVSIATLDPKSRLMGIKEGCSDLKGTLSTNETNGMSYEYVGQERSDSDIVYKKLQDSPRWPRRSEFREGQGLVSYKDKTSAHVAVCLLKEPSKNPTVTVSPCVYLPLSGVREDDERYSVPCNGKDSFNLYLHGNFFVDAGRQEFDVGDERHKDLTDPKDETSLRKAWNRILFSRSVLPLIIPELEKAGKKWNGESFDAFMSALPKVPYLESWQRDICATYRLLYAYDSDGWAWRKIKREDAVYSFPEPGNKEFLDLLWSSLPEGVHLVKLEKGGMVGPYEIRKQDHVFVEAVFDAASQIPVDELLTEKMFGFWRAFFERFPNQDGAFEFWRRIISSSKICRYDEFVKANAPLICCCSECFTSFLDCRVTHKGLPIWQKIAVCADRRIPLPDIGDGWLAGLRRDDVQIDDGEKMMEAVRCLPECDRTSGIAYDMALKIAKVVGISNLSSECRQFPYWQIDKEAFSYEQLIWLSEAGRLYRGKVDSFEKNVFLSAVDWNLLRVSSEDRREGLVDALGLEVPLLDADLFVRILKRAPELKDVRSRCELIKLLIRNDCSDNYGWKLAVQYLIHGEKSLHGKVWKLYYPKKSLLESDLFAGFVGIAMPAIAKAETGVAYSIPKEFFEILAGPVHNELSVFEVDNEFLVSLLADTPGLQFEAFGDDAWQTLLMLADSVYYNAHTKTLLRRIPLFRTDNDKRVALGNDSFLQGRPEVPSTFRQVVKVIPSCSDAEVDKRLKLVVSQWGYEDAIRFSKELKLSASDFADVVRPILHQLPRISDESREYVASAPWIKSAKGFVSTGMLLDLPGLRHVVEAECLVYPDDVLDDELWQDLAKHKLIPSRDASLKRVFEELAEDDKYRIGMMNGIDSVTAKEFLGVFDNDAVMPVAQILRECIELGFNCDVALPLLQKAMPLDRYIDVVNFLTDKVKAGAKWLFPYLEEMAPFLSMDVKSVSRLRVICKKLAVRTSSQVCTYAEGVSPEFVLHGQYEKRAPNFFKLLCDNRTIARPPSDKKPGNIIDYFKDWDPNFNERICGFVYCCTDDPETLEYARLHWGLDGRGDPESWRGKVCGELHNMMKNQQLKLWVYDASEVEVIALDGSKLRLGLEPLKEGGTLFYGEGNPCRYDPSPRLRCNCEGRAVRELELKLRRLKKNELTMSVAVLDSVLLNTLQKIVEHLCDQWAIATDEFWKELSNVEQVDIAVTRAKLLEKADVYLPMLRCDDSELARHVRVWDELGYEIQDAKKRQNGNSRYQELLRKKDEQLDKFAAAIESNPDVQKNILSAIREQMESYAYHRESILFELFQNADDAAEELRSLYPGKNTGFKDEFVVDYDRNRERLVIVHWGRRINQDKGLDTGGVTHHSFARDLEKMLMLMQSAKSGEGLNVTGKFGLGFKTVFFFSDEPIVMSGRLKFKIVGGFLPKVLDDAELVKMDPIWSKYANGSGVLKPTVFVLPIRHDCKGKVDEAMKAFAEHARLSALFSRRIKKVRMSFPDGRCLDVDGAAVESSGEKFVMRVSSGSYDSGAVVTGLRDGFPCKLGNPIPTYWVTVPTRQELGAGFIINGRFELDTGRSNLNRAASKNIKAIESMGKGLEEALCNDYLSRKDSSELVGFYESLWVVLSCCDENKVWEHDSAGLARGILWGEGAGGARNFYSKYPVFPTGLSGAYRVLTEICRVKYVLTAEVVDSPLVDVLGVAGLIPGTVVSGKLYPRACRKFIDGFAAHEFGMQQFFEEAMKSIGCFSPETANGLPGQKISELLISEERRPEAARGFVEQVRFLADDGKTWASVRDLVVDDGEESLKAAFCPRKAILSRQYDANGMRLFRKLRGQKCMSADQLARYAAAADSEQSRIYVLNYLLEKKDVQLAECLANKIQSEWLGDIREISWFKRLPTNEQLILAGMLDLGVSVIVDNSYNPPPSLPSVKPIQWKDVPLQYKPLPSLKDVDDWWQTNSSSAIVHYNNEAYGRSNPGRLDFNLEDIECRKSWMELLIIGAAHRLGFKLCQHKGFIKYLSEKGWLEVYSKSGVSAQEWMNTLDEYLEDEELALGTYSYWFRLFIRIYQFSRHLDDYVELFKTWNHAPECNKCDLVAIKTNSRLSGSGIDIPGLQSALGESTGLSFVYREMVRRGAITNPVLHKFCFVPYPKVSEFGGCLRDSEEIYKKAKTVLGEGRATFGLVFDIAITSYLKAH